MEIFGRHIGNLPSWLWSDDKPQPSISGLFPPLFRTKTNGTLPKRDPSHPFLTQDFNEVGTIPFGPDQQGDSSRTGSPVRGPSAAEKAMAAAAAEAAAATARAGARYKSQASNLDPQIAALKYAIETAFKQSLDQNLTDLDGLLTQQFDLLKKGSTERGGELGSVGRNNRFAEGSQQEESQSNLIRERADSLTAVLEQGAGQTDMLRAMVGAARNWNANAAKGNRAYFDSMQSLNASITDLNVDTQTGLANVHSQNQSERERLWQNYYDSRSESMTQLGNLYTQQADYLDMAKEMKTGEGGGSKKGSATTTYMDASKERGKSYKKEQLPSWISDYKGVDKVDAKVQNTNLAAHVKVEPLGNPEGATLRKWDG